MSVLSAPKVFWSDVDELDCSFVQMCWIYLKISRR